MPTLAFCKVLEIPFIKLIIVSEEKGLTIYFMFLKEIF
jgi:hypothetical protein